jgi:cytochrome c biogenesis protein ResB
VAQKLALSPAPLRKEDEENQFGVVFQVQGADAAQDGIYLVYEMVPHHPAIQAGEDTYRIIARKVERRLPFTVRLDSFRKFSYPGSDIAQEYESVVTVSDGALQWQAAIRMNEPLRYRGYTLYQSSFLEQGGEQVSVLTVVKNAGRVFPYIASSVMCAGLLVHLLLRWRARQRRVSA